MAEAPPRRPRHAAAVARILTTGASVALASGIVAVLGATAGPSAEPVVAAPAVAAVATAPPPPPQQRIVIVVRRAAPATPAARPDPVAAARPAPSRPRPAATPARRSAPQATTRGS